MRLDILSWQRYQHRNAAAVDAVGLPVEGDEIALFQLDGDQNVTGAESGEEKVPAGHGGRAPEGNEKP